LPADKRADVVVILDEIEAAGHTLRAVWDGFRTGAAATLVESKPLNEAIAELVRAKTTANRRAAYVASLEQYLRRWSKGQEAKPVAAVKLDEIDAFLNGLPSLSSRATAINRLSTLFSFAVRRGWRLDNPCERVERPHIENGKPAILTIDEAKKALDFTRRKMPRFLPWLALTLLAGVRPEEADRLTWKDVDLDRGVATIDAAASKVRARRNVHLKPAAVAWLRLGGTLPLPHVTRRRCIRKLRVMFKWDAWRKDVLRHSAASYWLASDQNAAKVALELGNSPVVLFKHYRELVSDEQAKAFWALMPKKGGRK
jgi:integrase